MIQKVMKILLKLNIHIMEIMRMIPNMLLTMMKKQRIMKIQT